MAVQEGKNGNIAEKNDVIFIAVYWPRRTAPGEEGKPVRANFSVAVSLLII